MPDERAVLMARVLAHYAAVSAWLCRAEADALRPLAELDLAELRAVADGLVIVARAQASSDRPDLPTALDEGD